MSEPLRFVDEDTGEVIEATAGGLSVDALRTYALAKVRGDAARADLAQRMAELQAADAEARRLAALVAEADMVTAAWELALGESFADDVRRSLDSGIVVDLGFVRICWPKPAKRWTMTAKLEKLAQDPALAKLLGVKEQTGKPAAPRITVRPDKFAGLSGEGGAA